MDPKHPTSEASAGSARSGGSAAVEKTDVVLVLCCYAAALGLLAAHDWKLPAALVFWKLGEFCKAEAMEEAARRKLPNDPSSATRP